MKCINFLFIIVFLIMFYVIPISAYEETDNTDLQVNDIEIVVLYNDYISICENNYCEDIFVVMPKENCKVFLTSENFMMEKRTNSDGVIKFKNIPSGIYKVSIKDKKYVFKNGWNEYDIVSNVIDTRNYKLSEKVQVILYLY